MIETIKKESKSQKIDELDCRDMKVGQFVRQGDLYILKLEQQNGVIPSVNGSTMIGLFALQNKQNCASVPKNGSVLANSRNHKVEFNEEHLEDMEYRIVEFGNFTRQDMVQRFCMPIQFKVTHPEHSDILLSPGEYCVSIQKEPRTRQRVID